ncbi:MCP four helix bundle domain-containing protein [Ideonella sp. 4Y16]|uniref:methyl-accepting chemotaxis protein n=1 Tax=Ideonella alba TaxID=2824118 RepID=UPI001B382EBD|nr:methyl-accepting chemotaxis protein [Ideonella alba]MBQ0942211.1 MCP four helix bundle domain-containing protein [Ideonella alba]
MHFSTFRTRLLAILLVVNVCVIVLGAFAFFFLGDLGGRLEQFTQGIYHRLEVANRLQESALARGIAVRNLALLSDPGQRQQQVDEFQRRQKDTTEALAELQRAIQLPGVSPEVREKVAVIASVEARYAPVATEIVKLLQEGQRDDAIARIDAICTPTLNQLGSAIHDYMTLTGTRTRGFVADTEHATEVERVIMLAMALGAAGVAALMGYLLRQNVRRTLGAEPEELSAFLGRMAEGDLSAAAVRDARSERSVLAAMARMQQQMGQVVREVRVASDSIATGSTEIASGNADLSRRTEQQASNLQQTASAMEQMNRAVQQNAEAAHTATGLAGSVSDAASSGSEVMGRVIDTMSEISRSSAKIGEIIGVIDGIAFQTNILALNAAVEAARAGEQGRGFAVVAGEVRTLAQRSADAAKEIKALISASTERVDVGTKLVAEAGQRVGNIVAEVRRVADLIQEMGHSAQEQSSGIAQVSASVTSLDQTTQQNAALAEQSSAAAESLKSQSGRLASAVCFFRLS